MTEYPNVSVIIPMRNEEKHIAQCLDSLLRNDYPRDKVEILFADGMSIDRSREIIAEYARKCPGIQIIDNPGRIVPTGLNKAIGLARGEFIVRVDCHTQFAPDYIRQCVELLQTRGAVNVGGAQRAVGDCYFTRAIAIATMSRFAAGDAKFRYSDEEVYVETVYLGAWRKETLLKVGGFNEEWVVNQDFELNHRLRKMGGKILLSPRIRCEYSVRPSIRTLAKQYYRYGYWKVKTLKTYPESLRWRQLIAPLFVLGCMVSCGVLFISKSLGLLLPVLYAAANLAAALSCAKAHGWRYLPMLPFIFAVIHFSWGSGFWLGLTRFGVPRFKLANYMSALRPVNKLEANVGSEPRN